MGTKLEKDESVSGARADVEKKGVKQKSDDAEVKRIYRSIKGVVDITKVGNGVFEIEIA